jgi:hypothetical protein
MTDPVPRQPWDTWESSVSRPCQSPGFSKGVDPRRGRPLWGPSRKGAPRGLQGQRKRLIAPEFPRSDEEPGLRRISGSPSLPSRPREVKEVPRPPDRNSGEAGFPSVPPRPSEGRSTNAEGSPLEESPQGDGQEDSPRGGSRLPRRRAGRRERTGAGPKVLSALGATSPATAHLCPHTHLIVTNRS